MTKISKANKKASKKYGRINARRKKEAPVVATTKAAPATAAVAKAVKPKPKAKAVRKTRKSR